ncbi:MULTISPECIES: hypothetical protein [unclassified Chelatococcus]|uniref:hypothetical protein n=1 Tax=unclassified Chelatococcus TaxID=2638111 RepID=UPI001BCBD9A5|nr:MULTISPECIES: hypothetical protein [unclassified Chelatococcus]CAH1662476.1 conserved hypothetical protein [Hyphomicrobiales bacterium]MBS7741387.1 hypothetical protein [Chelatococcus sp. HY11]MBX3546131.1 hypothetical protein [Chelatococcus sp.]MCO5077220.1 hypothetical protein [Chelatococcus sp.]CAH1682676.1 conserved hypothetical protein [Hyphomicrobiales bacterium]
MTKYPDIRAAGASIEVELEQGVTIAAYVGDVDVAFQLQELWSMRHSLAASAAHVSRQLSVVGRQPRPDEELRALLADLRRQIDEFEASYEVH